MAPVTDSNQRAAADLPTSAWAFGLATIAGTDDASQGAVLDTWYPSPRLGNAADAATGAGTAAGAGAVEGDLAPLAGLDPAGKGHAQWLVEPVQHRAQLLLVRRSLVNGQCRFD